MNTRWRALGPAASVPFFSLKRIINVVGCVTIAGFTLTQIGLCVGGWIENRLLTHIQNV